jgi:hypothetical protein
VPHQVLHVGTGRACLARRPLTAQALAFGTTWFTYIGTMLSALKKYLLVPKLMRLSVGAPKDHHVAWDRYWSNV